MFHKQQISDRRHDISHGQSARDSFGVVHWRVFQSRELVSKVSFETLKTTHEIEFEICLGDQLSGRRDDVTSVGEQGTIKINPMKGAVLEEPSDVVCVFIWYD